MAASTSTAYQDSARDSVALSAQVLTNRQTLYLLNQCFGAPASARATTATMAKTVATSGIYLIDGAKQTAVAGTDNFWTLAGTTVPVGSFCIFMLGVTSGGTAAVIQSSIAGSLATCNFNIAGSNTTSAFDGFSIFSNLSITAGSTSSGFIPGTTALNATGITATFADGPGPNWLPILGDANGGLQVWRPGAGPNALI